MWDDGIIRESYWKHIEMIRSTGEEQKSITGRFRELCRHQDAELLRA